MGRNQQGRCAGPAQYRACGADRSRRVPDSKASRSFDSEKDTVDRGEAATHLIISEDLQNGRVDDGADTIEDAGDEQHRR